MKRTSLLLLCLALPACGMMRRPVVTYVPPEEAAWFRLPHELLKEGQETLPGTMAAAIQLAMDDFLPREAQVPRDASPQEHCLHQRQAHDIEAAPLAEDVMLVRITTSPGACQLGRASAPSMGATYAVDTRNWRILAVRWP
jgi:hypothetical protein